MEALVFVAVLAAVAAIVGPKAPGRYSRRPVSEARAYYFGGVK